MQTPLWLKRLIIFLPVLFAHKPLCSFFRKDLFCLKGVYICRSCFFLVLGFFVSILSIVLFNLAKYRIYIYLSILFPVIIFIFSYPRIYRILTRSIKDWLRFFLGWSGVNVLLLLVFKKIFLFLGVLGFLLILRMVYSEERNKIKNKICDNCQEFHQDKLCSGFLPKSKLMKKYEDYISQTLIRG